MVKLLSHDETVMYERIDTLMVRLKRMKRRTGSLLIMAPYSDEAKKYLSEFGFRVANERKYGNIAEFYIRRVEAW